MKPNIGHGILFHEPHPGGVDGEITLRNAMVIGRRLRHAFGWCGDMVFVTKGLEGRRLSLEEVAKLKKLRYYGATLSEISSLDCLFGIGTFRGYADLDYYRLQECNCVLACTRE